jgi:hypothetical protein
MSDPFNVDGDIGGHAEEDDETVVEHLKRVWCNERCAPNLLQCAPTHTPALVVA